MYGRDASLGSSLELEASRPELMSLLISELSRPSDLEALRDGASRLHPLVECRWLQEHTTNAARIAEVYTLALISPPGLEEGVGARPVVDRRRTVRRTVPSAGQSWRSTQVSRRCSRPGFGRNFLKE